MHAVSLTGSDRLCIIARVPSVFLTTAAASCSQFWHMRLTYVMKSEMEEPRCPTLPFKNSQLHRGAAVLLLVSINVDSGLTPVSRHADPTDIIAACKED